MEQPPGCGPGMEQFLLRYFYDMPSPNYAVLYEGTWWLGEALKGLSNERQRNSHEVFGR